MCGPTTQQTELGNDQIEAYQQAQQLTQEQYADQQAIYGPMSAQFSSIFDKGPSQQGFSASETQNLDASAVAGTAQNYEQAAKATGESEAAEGGGTNPLPSGGQEQLKAETANSSAAQESTEENQINTANYAQGYSEWQNAGEGLQAIAAGDNPLGYEGAATSSGSAASSTANQIATEQNSWVNAALGAAGSIGGAVVGENPGGVFGG